MIDDLASQIEARFAELERELSDPEVIADRGRFTAASRAYSELEPAARLAARSQVARPSTGMRRPRWPTAATPRSQRCNEPESSTIRSDCSNWRSTGSSSLSRPNGMTTQSTTTLDRRARNANPDEG